MVTSKGSTHHGKKGKIDSFCKNGSNREINVKFDNGDSTRLRITSITMVPPTAASPAFGTTVIDVTGVQSVPAEVDVRRHSTDRSMRSATGTIRTSETSGTSYREKVLELWEYVGRIREQNSDNGDLNQQLKEVEKTILGLNLDD